MLISLLVSYLVISKSYRKIKIIKVIDQLTGIAHRPTTLAGQEDSIAFSYITFIILIAHCGSDSICIQIKDLFLYFGCKVLGIETLTSSPLLSPE